MKRALAVAVLVAGCSRAPELALSIQLPADPSGLKVVSTVELSASRNGVILAQRTFSGDASSIGLSSVSYGDDTVIALDGLDAAGSVIARGRTCPFSFAGAGTRASLYFSTTSSFAATASSPVTAREEAVVAALTDGSVLLAGGSDGAGKVLDGCERFRPGEATFTALATTLLHARRRAQAVELPSIGLLVTGGLDASGATVADGELYVESQQSFTPILGTDGRVGHRAVLFSDGLALVVGGSTTDGGAPLASTVFVHVLSTGDYQVSAGPTLAVARREPAVVAVTGGALVFGGYGSDGVPTKSIELIAADPATGVVASEEIGALTTARAEATATLTSQGVLVVGGVGSDGAPLATAELFSTTTRKSTNYDLAFARRHHAATLLSTGDVLVAGGLDVSGAALSSVELFRFLGDAYTLVSARPLVRARGQHVAVPLCDETVLVIGGGSGAELYTERSPE